MHRVLCFNPLTLFIGMLHLQNYSRDLFLFLYFLLIIVAAMTSFKVHQDKSAFTGKSILYLNRHQTEEWKGWMQVLIILIFFLLWSFLVPQECFLLILFPRNIVGWIATVHAWALVYQNYRNDAYVCGYKHLLIWHRWHVYYNRVHDGPFMVYVPLLSCR